MEEEALVPSIDGYAERANMVRILALSIDAVKDVKSRDLMRMTMVRLIASIGPEVKEIKPVLTAFVKPGPSKL